MGSSRAIKFLSPLAVVIAVIVGVNLYFARIARGPKHEKLADCASERFSFPLNPRSDHSYYHLAIGVPAAATHESFLGEVQLCQSTGVVARFAISSDDVARCNWLGSEPGLVGYALAWSRTNRGERFDDLLVRGQNYEVRVEFSKCPPPGSSLWLSWIGRL